MNTLTKIALVLIALFIIGVVAFVLIFLFLWGGFNPISQPVTGERIQLSDSPLAVVLRQGEIRELFIGDNPNPVQVVAREVQDNGTVLFLTPPGGNGTEVPVLDDGTESNVDLNGDNEPDLGVSQQDGAAGTSPSGGVPLRFRLLVPSATISGALVPRFCVEGFERNSRVDVVLLMDKSLSMDYPVKQESEAPLPADLAVHVRTLQTKLPQLKQAITDEQLADYLGTGRCNRVPSDYVDLCTEVDNAFEGARSILVADPVLYERYSKMGAARKTATNTLNAVRTAQRLSRADIEVAVVAFAGSSDVEIALTSDFGAVQSTINGLETESSTNIGAGLQDSFFELEGKETDKRVIVLLTDGRPSTGMESDEILQDLLSRAQELNTTIYSIGMGLIEEEVDKELLTSLASNTGGTYRFASTGTELQQAFESTLGIGRVTCST